jgi:DNA-binding NtrC family response regulator
VVEDEALVAKGLELVFSRHGHTVASVVDTGEEAVAIACDLRPDLVFMDIHLAGEMDGIEAAGVMRERFGIPVVFLTAYLDDETLSRAKVTEPYGYLIKPFQEREVLATIEMALHKHASEKALAVTRAELERAHEELGDQKRFFETLFHAIPCGVLVVGADNRVRAMNPLAEEMLGLCGESAKERCTGELLGCPHALAGTCGDPDSPFCGDCSLQTTIRRALGGDPTRRLAMGLRCRSLQKTRHADLQVSASAVTVGGETLCLVLLEDVTELSSLREQVRKERSFAGIVGQDPSMVALFGTIRELAPSAVPVLILGESGTGKELVATAIHNESPRAGQRFVAVNCGALPENLLESELFGHEKGAFTGATRDKKGRFELADGGTLFLDEVGELSQAMQVKLLRVLQGGTFERVGGERTLKVDVRILSATNKDLKREVAEGNFRSDLYYRLCVVPVHLPPLRERRRDIPLLARHLLERMAGKGEAESAPLDSEALAILMDFPWPGNVRELENALHFALIKSQGGPIRAEHLPPSMREPVVRPLQDLLYRPPLDWERVATAIREAGGNKVQAAKFLGVSRATLYRFLGRENHAPDDSTPGGADSTPRSK